MEKPLPTSFQSASDKETHDRIQRAVAAQRQVSGWVKLLKREAQSSGMFSVVGPVSDGFSFYIGKIEELLSEQGYTITSHSSTIRGKDADGNDVAQVSLLIKTKDGAVKRVSLA